jgi:ribonuclease HII
MNLRKEKYYWKKGYKIIVGLDEVGRGCEKIDAEVLTNNGWKFYADIDPKDKVLSYMDNGYMKWQKIEKIIKKDFEGNLIELKNRAVNIIVTPNHFFTIIKRVFKRDKKDNNKLKIVDYKTRKKRKIVTDLLNNDFIPRGGKWKGTNKNFFKLPTVDKNKEKLIDIKLWVAFLGIFLSEGSVSYYKKNGSYKITISQNKDVSQDKYKKIYRLLKDFPFHFNGFKTGFTCYHKQLYTYLKQFKNCYHKFIPKKIKELSPELLNIFIDWMILGDGTSYTGKNRKEVRLYYTVSKRLRDDFEEILLKAGWTYHTTIRMPKRRRIGKRIIKKENQVPCFEIRLRRNNKIQVKSLHKRNVPYKGHVFCLQLSNYHNFYVRRNGTGYFTGNSLSGPVTSAAVIVNSKLKIKNKNFKEILKNTRDSKKLSEKQREKIFKLTQKCPNIKFTISSVGPQIIDKINISRATKKAMKNCLNKILPKYNLKNILILIDGNRIIDKNLKISQKAIVKGDDKIFSIALASIIAKVTRDRKMKKLSLLYPEYCFHQHKGYGTKLHKKLIKKYGPCKIHRKSYRPIKK